MTENEIASPVLDAAFLLHTKPDLGRLETVVLAHELRKKGLSVERQLPMPIVYDGIRFDEAFRNGIKRIINKTLEPEEPRNFLCDLCGLCVSNSEG